MAYFRASTYLERSDSLFEATGVTSKGDRQSYLCLPRIKSTDAVKTLDRFSTIDDGVEALKDQDIYFNDQKIAK